MTMPAASPLERHLVCAIEMPTSSKYWEIVAAVALARLGLGTVLLLVPNEREMLLLEKTFQDLQNMELMKTLI